MALVPLTPANDYAVLESAYYEGTVTAVTVESHDADIYHDKPYNQLRWSWAITVPEQDETSAYTSWTSLSLNEKAKLPGLLRALGIEIPAQLDTDALVGLSCRLNIEEKIRDDGTSKNHTAGYAPIKRTTGQPAANGNGSTDGGKPASPTMLATLKQLIVDLHAADPNEEYVLPETLTRDEARAAHKDLKDKLTILDAAPF